MFRGQTVKSWMLNLLLAANVGAASTEWHGDVRHWTSEDGLPQSLVQEIAQTPDGYLWLATRFGLARFDGVRFTSFNKRNSPGLTEDAISSLTVDRAGTLWLGTLDGLVEWRGGVVRRFTRHDGLPDNKVWQVLARPEGGIWWRSGSRIGAWDGKLLTCFTREQGLATNGIFRIKLTPRGQLLALNAVGAQTLDGASGQFSRITQWPFHGDWRDAQEDLGGRLWMGDSRGFYRFENGGWAALGTCFEGDNVPNDHPLGLFAAEDGGWWIGTRDAGVVLWRDGRFERFAPAGIDPALRLTCVFQDREGNTWFGTEGAGLVQWRRRLFRNLTERDGLPHRNAWSICAGPGDRVWVGTERGAACIRENRAVPLALPNDGLPVNPVGVDSRGMLWMARSGQGIFSWDGSKVMDLSANVVPNLHIDVFHLDRAGRFWIGQPHGLFVLYPDGRAETLFAGKFRDGVRAVFDDSHGDVWFGTHGEGVKVWHDGRLESFTTLDGLSNNRAWAFHEDTAGAIWIGTEGGLTRWKNGKFFALTERHGLRELVVNHILEDNSDHLWLSGLRGIYRVSRVELDSVAEGRLERAAVAVFGEADGMANAETNGEHQPAGCKTADGRLWFPTQGGVVVIDPERLPEHEPLPPVVIEEVKAEGERRSFASGRALEFPAGRGRVLEINYTANCMSAPEKVRFKWSLEPRDREWHEVGAQRSALLQNLRPGGYTFRVQACNPHGLWNEAGASLAFVIAPRFHETWLFYSLCGAAVMAATAGFTAYRLCWQRRWLTARHGQALSEERARIARDLHDDLGTAMMGVALEIDMARRQSGDGLAMQLGESAARVRSLAERMREAVWAINPQCDSVSSLASFLEEQAGTLMRAGGVNGRFEFPEDIPPLALDADTRHQLALGVREALTNALRHAQAKEVVLRLALRENALVVSVEDDGRGFDASAAGEPGHGLHNLRVRLERVGGVLTITSMPGAGTRVVMQVPLTH